MKLEARKDEVFTVGWAKLDGLDDHRPVSFAFTAADQHVCTCSVGPPLNWNLHLFCKSPHTSDWLKKILEPKINYIESDWLKKTIKAKINYIESDWLKKIQPKLITSNRTGSKRSKPKFIISRSIKARVYCTIAHTQLAIHIFQLGSEWFRVEAMYTRPPDAHGH